MRPLYGVAEPAPEPSCCGRYVDPDVDWPPSGSPAVLVHVPAVLADVMGVVCGVAPVLADIAPVPAQVTLIRSDVPPVLREVGRASCRERVSRCV